MSNTVSNPVKPSDEEQAVRRSVDAQFPLVAQLVASGRQGAPLPMAPPAAPRTWTFTDRDTDEQMTFTCMVGCTLNHASDVASPTFRQDIWCQAAGPEMWLPINTDGKPEEFRVLGITLNVRPWDRKLSERLPHVDIEFIDDHWVENLDPDGLATVIRTLAERVESLKVAHAQLVAVRAEYMGRK
ncbi:DUF6907 domain-containing protein [Streptomyces sp. NPDC051561]|uniref:DUF6907 domain-containing protein n=1 Tax=Streptomyces sp. NPDC051561 TaxID=3365658 RepID=UPI0037AB20BD